MSNHSQLGLHEEMLLLARKGEQGSFYFGTRPQFPVAGAIVMELILQNRLQLCGRRNRSVEVVNPASLGDPLLDECLGMISVKRPVGLATLVRRISSIWHVLQRVARGLCDKDILREQRESFLFIFRYTDFIQVDPTPKRQLLERLSQAIFTESEDIDPRTAVIVSLAKSSDLLDKAIDTPLLRVHRKRIKQIAEGESVGKATKEVIVALRAAAAVAGAAAATMIVTTGS